MSGSQNLRLVEYFVSEFYRKRALELEHIVSTRFTFKLHTLPPVNFKDFADRMAYISDNSTLKIQDIYSDDDVTFFAKSTIYIPREDDADFEALGLNTFFIKNGLLDKVVVDYELSEDEFKYLQMLLKKNAETQTEQTEEKPQEPILNDIEFI